MSIRRYETEFGNIYKDTAILGNNTYLDNGQGCGTIFYKNVASARKALKALDGKVISGQDLCNCKKCSCSYSYDTRQCKMYLAFICKKSKRIFAELFEE